jgi:hypothetical protein
LEDDTDARGVPRQWHDFDDDA